MPSNLSADRDSPAFLDACVKLERFQEVSALLTGEAQPLSIQTPLMTHACYPGM